MESIMKSEYVVTLNGKMISFVLTDKRATGGKHSGVLHFRRMTFDSHSGKIVQTFAGQSSARGKHYFSEIIVCCCTTDSRTGETLPCILLNVHRKGSATFGYVLLIFHNSNELEHHLAFECEHELKGTVRLLSGPSVFWSSDDSVHYISFETAAILTIPVSFSSVKWIGEVDSDLILLGSRKINESITMDEKYHSTSDELVWGSEFVGYAVKQKANLRGDQFIPHAYSSVVTNMFLCPIEEIDDQSKCTVVASTCEKQLILFENGVPKDVCQLPFEEANEIKMGTTGRENCLFLVSSRAGGVCAVSKESWQVVASWEPAWSVHLDDFLGTGSEQILLLSMTSSSVEACLKDFILTDLCEFNYTTNSEHPEDRPQILNQATQEQYHHTIQALEARLQSGLATFHELQHLLADKEKVLLQCSKALMNIVEGNPCTLPDAEEEGLVSLWDEEETDLQLLEKEMDSTTQVLNHSVQAVWQRIVDDSWVVGVQLSESVTTTVDFVSLFLVMDRDLLNVPPMIESHSKVLKLSKSVVPLLPPRCTAEPPLKKLKLDLQGMMHASSVHKDLFPNIRKDQLQTVTAVTKLSPLLMYNNVRCSVLLYGIKGPSQETELTKREIILPCGSVSLNLEDIWNEKYIVQLILNPQVHSDKAEEDVVAVMTTFQRASFSMFSREYTLANVKEWLMGPMQCEPLKIYPEYLLCSRWGALHVLLLNWNLQNPFKGTLTVFYRSQSHLLRCLQSLIGVLPQACTIVHINLGCEDQMTDALGVALEKEALEMQNIITSAISEVENEFTMRAKTKKKISNPRLDSEEKLQLYREKFQMEQEQSISVMNLTIDEGVYRKITQKLIDIQQDTDNSAWRLSIFNRAFAKTLVNL